RPAGRQAGSAVCQLPAGRCQWFTSLNDHALSAMPTDPKEILFQRIRCWGAVFIAGVIVSGATAIPLEWGLNLAARMLAKGNSTETESSLLKWVIKVQHGLHETYSKYPFLAFGTDWLAFGHFVIAIAFLGAYRDPVRKAWLFAFGTIACWLVIPFA